MNRLSFVSLLAAGQQQAQRSLIRGYGSSSSPMLCTTRVKLSTEALSLKNRFLQAMVLSMTVDRHILPEEDVKLYGYQRRATKGPLEGKDPTCPDQLNSVDKERWAAWKQCNDLSQAESQEKYIDVMNPVRIRAGKEAI